MDINDMQDQAEENTRAMADRQAGRTNNWASRVVHRSEHGGRVPSRAGKAGLPMRGVLMSMLGGDSTGEATGSATVE